MVGSAMGYKIGRAPAINRIDKIDANTQNLGNPTPLITPCDTFEPYAPDIRALLGSPGKNVAVKGDTVVAIAGEYSNDPDNIFNGVKAYYSFDGGNTWQSFYLSTSLCRRAYSGVIWPDAAGISWAGSPSPLFFWHEARREGGVYQPSHVYIAWDIAWPTGIFWVVELPYSADHNVWLPSADAKGDTIVVTGFGFTTSQGYVWISTDGGNTWTIDTLFPDLQMDSPIPRIGSTPNYLTAISEVYTTYPWGEALVPYFFESTDGGQTWNKYNLWELAHGGVPYDSCMGGWWYVYDYVLGPNDRPLIVWKFGTGTHEYGDIWFYKPTAGGPGNWTNWTYQLLVGQGNGATVATQPYITIDPITKAIFVDYKAWFIQGTDTFPHIGVLGSKDEGTNWPIDEIWPGFDAFEEEATELPVYSPSSAGVVPLHVTFCDYNLAPGDPLLHAGPFNIVSIDESSYKISSKSTLLNVKKVNKEILINFSLPYPSNVDISLYTSTGEKIATIYKGNEPSKTIRYMISNLANGIYFIKLSSPSGNSTAKFVLIK
jgi:hypothetical protein